MVRFAAASLGLLLLIAAQSAAGQVVKDQSRVAAGTESPAGTGPLAAEPTPAPTPEQANPDTLAPAEPDAGTGSEEGTQPDATTEPDAGPNAQDGEDLTLPPDDTEPDAQDSEPVSPDDLSLGEIPVIETVELTADAAKRALDVFAVVRVKYRDDNLEDYEDLQEFVEKGARGKEFEADVKAGWFSNVNEWNRVITTVGFAYSAITEDQSDEIRLQIEEIKKDATLAQDMKDRMIASLTAMIPSDNNKKVVQDLMNDPAYVDKLALLVEDE